MTNRYYKPSGIIPIGGALLAVLIGLVFAVVTGYIVGLLCYINPFVYVNLGGIFFLGGLPSSMVAKFAYNGKVRNKSFLMIAGFAIGIVTIYFSWVGYVTMFDDAIQWKDLSFLKAIISPQTIWNDLTLIAQQGGKSMFGFKPSGVFLYAMWSVEAVAVLLLSTSMSSEKSEPFCEQCNIWTISHEETPEIQICEKQEFIANLEKEKYEVLDELLKINSDPLDYFRVTFNTCPHCSQLNSSESSYLSVISVKTKVDKHGRKDAFSVQIIRNLIVPHLLVETFTGKSKALEELREQQATDNSSI